MLINKNTEAFKNLDTTLRRIASDNNISNVNSVSISQVPEGLMLKFSYGEDDTTDFDVDVDEDLPVSNEDDVDVLKSDDPLSGWEELAFQYVKDLVTDTIPTTMFYSTSYSADGEEASRGRVNECYIYLPKDPSKKKELVMNIESEDIPRTDISISFTNTSEILDKLRTAVENKGFIFNTNFDDLDDELSILLDDLDNIIPQI